MLFLPFIPDALSCAYITGYTIFKYGQLEDYCIDCYTKLITATCNARYLRLIKHLGNFAGNFSLFIIIYLFTFLSYFPDRGGLKYPCEPITYRMWTMYLYFRQIFPQIRKCSKIVDDLVAFVVPILSKCDEFKCDNGKHSTFLTTFVCKRFFLAVLRTEEKRFRVRYEKVPIVSNKPQKRKVMKLQK